MVADVELLMCPGVHHDDKASACSCRSAVVHLTAQSCGCREQTLSERPTDARADVPHIV